MPVLNLKPSHKPVKEYYKALGDVRQLSLLHEGAVAPAFANLLRACASRMNWTFAEQYQIPRKGRRPLRADGVFLDQFKLRTASGKPKTARTTSPKKSRKSSVKATPRTTSSFKHLTGLFWCKTAASLPTKTSPSPTIW